MPYTTGILLFDDVEELDFAGPLEVFAMARKEGDRVVTIAERNEPVRGNLGLRVLPDYTLADAPPLDVLVVPGGMGTRREAENPTLLDWIKSVAANCTWVTSVCTGSMLLEAAGVVEGRKITTHWAMIDSLRQKAGVTVVDSRRYVRDGNVVTAAGVSAGIDMALWVVGQLYDVDHARAVQRFMEYDPAPPYAAEV
jgi:transcriptional regulator GlxA family with amidase domain